MPPAPLRLAAVPRPWPRPPGVPGRHSPREAASSSSRAPETPCQSDFADGFGFFPPPRRWCFRVALCRGGKKKTRHAALAEDAARPAAPVKPRFRGRSATPKAPHLWSGKPRARRPTWREVPQAPRLQRRSPRWRSARRPPPPDSFLPGPSQLLWRLQPAASAASPRSSRPRLGPSAAAGRTGLPSGQVAAERPLPTNVAPGPGRLSYPRQRRPHPAGTFQGARGYKYPRPGSFLARIVCLAVDRRRGSRGGQLLRSRPQKVGTRRGSPSHGVKGARTLDPHPPAWPPCILLPSWSA